jgi:LysR family transcriptional regulator, benzoate and cis,cis-muconate-responsive activator of ben and cat genes
LPRGRPITLTDSGRYFFEQAVQVLQRTDEICAMTRRIGTGKKRQFGIGFVASTLYDVLPELIRRFRLMAPGVEIVLTELTTLEQAAALKVGRIDIGFGDCVLRMMGRPGTSSTWKDSRSPFPAATSWSAESR